MRFKYLDNAIKSLCIFFFMYHTLYTFCLILRRRNTYMASIWTGVWLTNIQGTFELTWDNLRSGLDRFSWNIASSRKNQIVLCQWMIRISNHVSFPFKYLSFIWSPWLFLFSFMWKLIYDGDVHSRLVFKR